MKVIGFNGSPREKGNTYTAMRIIMTILEREGIETEIIQVGSQKVNGCTACQSCSKMGNQKCIVETDEVNKWIQKMKEADDIIFGSPTYFAGVNGTMKSFLDRAFYVSSANNNLFRHKVGVAVAAVRRSGGLQVMDQLNKYIQHSEMLMPVSNYWNVIHGAKPEEVLKDPEGVQIMEMQGENMAWLLKIIELSKGKIDPRNPLINY